MYLVEDTAAVVSLESRHYLGSSQIAAKKKERRGQWKGKLHSEPASFLPPLTLSLCGVSSRLPLLPLFDPAEATGMSLSTVIRPPLTE